MTPTSPKSWKRRSSKRSSQCPDRRHGTDTDPAIPRGRKVATDVAPANTPSRTFVGSSAAPTPCIRAPVARPWCCSWSRWCTFSAFSPTWCWWSSRCWTETLWAAAGEVGSCCTTSCWGRTSSTAWPTPSSTASAPGHSGSSAPRSCAADVADSQCLCAEAWLMRRPGCYRSLWVHHRLHHGTVWIFVPNMSARHSRTLSPTS